ncbi:protein C2-DOMAIN ABA-RELATED 3-like [Typha angustifolia]|uniref:protein C2-DOMAIN ABA-RELATED 3-like n=1 Tax=Typha angustifolia TaxID=59011 RepID=UPI003C2B9520
MEHLLGLLRVKVVRGINLAYRDARGSDPYVILKLGNQKLKTSVKKKNVNPEWNEDLTLSIANPVVPIRLEVYDKDTFSKDDKMGDAEIDIQPFVEVAKLDLEGISSGSVVRAVRPCKENCLADESHVIWKNEKIVQNMILRLRNVESGEVELQLQWVKMPGRV